MELRSPVFEIVLGKLKKESASPCLRDDSNAFDLKTSGEKNKLEVWELGVRGRGGVFRCVLCTKGTRAAPITESESEIF